MSNKLGLGFLGDPSVHEMARLARLAEEAGFDSIWTAETRFARDAITTATAIALATTKVRVATAVVNVYTRGAALLGVTMATLDEAANGRAILGIGPGSPLVLQPQGYAFDQPLSRLREYTAAVRAVLNGDSLRGTHVTIDGVRLDFRPPRATIPIYFGVTGPRACRLAGEIADGVILNAFTPVDYTRRAVENVRGAAERAGRDPSQVEITGAVVVAPDRPGRPGREVVAPLVATYLTRFPNIAKESGVPEETLASYRAIAAEHGVEHLGTLLPTEIIDRLTVTGTPEQCRARIDEYRRAGLELPILFPASSEVEPLISLAQA